MRKGNISKRAREIIKNKLPDALDVKKGWQIGKTSSRTFVLTQCRLCHKEMWQAIHTIESDNYTHLCLSCNRIRIAKQNLMGKERETHPNWKGGKIEHKGRILIRLYPDNFFYPMVGSGRYVLESRLVMAKHLSRCLLPWEIVHHKNGIKDDNR